MNIRNLRGIILAVPALLTANVHAAFPVEREVQSVHTVQVYDGTDLNHLQRPIGAIDFSASNSSVHRFGPWDAETDAFRNADSVIFYDDGSARNNAKSRQYNQPDGSRCETLGKVTVCR